jgi:hypothetical protein
MYIRTSFLQRLKHTPKFPVYCAFVSRCLVALRPWKFLHLCTVSSEHESYITTDVQSASLSWNKAPIRGLRPDFYYCQTVAVLLMWGSLSLSLSDERMGLSFTIAAHCLLGVSFKVKVTLRLAVYRQSVRLGVKPFEIHDQTFFQLNSCGNSPYVTSSLTRRWVCIFLAISSSYITSSWTSRKICPLPNNRRLLLSRTVVGFT